MSANVKNSAVATGLEKVSFHSNAKEGQYQTIVAVIIFNTLKNTFKVEL